MPARASCRKPNEGLLTEILNDRVVPFYDEHGIRLSRMPPAPWRREPPSSIGPLAASVNATTATKKKRTATPATMATNQGNQVPRQGVATFRLIHNRSALLLKRPSAACRCGLGLLSSPGTAIAAEASMSETLSIEMEDEVRRALDRLVQRTARSVDDIVNQAVRDYLEVQEWQQRKIEAGIAAADRGEFATEEELARIAAKYSKRG